MSNYHFMSDGLTLVYLRSMLAFPALTNHYSSSSLSLNCRYRSFFFSLILLQLIISLKINIQFSTRTFNFALNEMTLFRSPCIYGVEQWAATRRGSRSRKSLLPKSYHNRIVTCNKDLLPSNCHKSLHARLLAK